MFMIMTYLYLHTKCPELKQFLKLEFIERIDEDDIDYHLQRDSQSYDTLNNFITSSEDIKALDEFLQEKQNQIKENREKEHEYNKIRRIEEEQRQIESK